MGAQGVQRPDQAFANLYFRRQHFVKEMAGVWARSCFQMSAVNALHLLSSQEHKTRCQWTCPEPVFAAFLFLFSYYIKSPVITELTAGKDLHMA